MVCNELDEVYAQFRDLSPHKRINIMCGMLRMCLPPELRFIGSVVEDLAKKEYHFLREHELKANNPVELMKYNTSDEWTLHNAMALHLSLLHSWNTNCANTIFSILENKLKPSAQITDLDSMEKKLLILAMAMNHPAFTFHQRKTIYDYYQRVDHQLKSLRLCKSPEVTEQSSVHSRMAPGSPQQQQQQQQQPSSRTLVKDHKSQEEKDQKQNGSIPSSASQITCSVSNRSSRVSPSQSPQLVNNVSTDSRSNSPTEQELSSILTRLNINKHQCLEKIPPEQLSGISIGELIKLGLSKEEAARVRSELDHAQREKPVNLPNGIIEPPATQICYGQHGAHPCMTVHPHGPQPTIYPAVYMYQPHFNPAGLVSNRVNSPVESDYSSPSPSPLHHTKISKGTDSSSDENEKGTDKHSPTGSPLVEINPGTKVVGIESGVRQTEEGKQAVPSTVGVEVQGGSVIVGSGYQSDPSPTPSGYLHVINMPRYKAQPAHINMNIPPKNVISMPPDSQIIGKRSAALIPVGLAPPIPRSDVITTSIMTSTTMTSVSGTHEYGKRVIMGHPAIRSTAINGGHRTFACTVTNATTLTMATPLSSSAIGSGNITVPQTTSGMKVHMTTENSMASIQQQQPQQQDMPSALPAPTHIASPVPVTHSSGSNYVQHATTSQTTCSSCGCPGHSEMSATYPYLHHILPSHVLPGQQMWHMPMPMTPTSNGIIPTPHHFFPPGYHAYHIPNLTPNGLTHPEFMLGNHHPNFVHSAIPTPFSMPSGNIVAPANGSHHGLQRSNSINERREKPRKMTCHNCGSSEHSASECQESSMEHISGSFHLSYEPTSD